MVDGRIGELTRVQSDWREGSANLVQSRISNFNKALDEAFCIEMMSLGAREESVEQGEQSGPTSSTRHTDYLELMDARKRAVSVLSDAAHDTAQDLLQLQNWMFDPRKPLSSWLSLCSIARSH